MKRRGTRVFGQFAIVVAALLMALVCGAQTTSTAPPAQASSAPGAPSGEKLFSNEQLDQMMAPIALYPDSLLAQLLMACTYPSDVAEAAAWSKQHPDDKGDAAVEKVKDMPWDPSVQSLVAFPQVLVQLADQADWVQKVGDAFLAQPNDVMDSAQRLRAQAKKAGNLQSNEQQKVVETKETTTNTTVIEIQPSNPETVYVPSYNPTTVYGSWAYPSYPPPYWPPPPYYYPGTILAAGISFGIAVGVTNALWGGCGWGHGDVNVNVNKYNNINNSSNRINGSGNQKLNHNAQNRRGTPYADQRSRDQYGQGRGGASDRQSYRGQTGGQGAGRDASRQNAQQALNNRGGGQGAAASRGQGAGNRAASGGAGANANSRLTGGTQSTPAARSNSSAFSGASSPQASQRQSSRGQSSMQSSRSGGGGSAGRQTSRPTPQRSGGGGGRRR